MEKYCTSYSIGKPTKSVTFTWKFISANTNISMITADQNEFDKGGLNTT
jgi:hypothetical protein